MLLLLVSMWTAPYSWFTDEIILAPAILRAVYLCDASGRSLIPFGILDAAALALVVWGFPLASGVYVWTASAWLAWYLNSTRTAGTRLMMPAPIA